MSSSCSLTNTDFSVSPPASTTASQVNPTGNCGVNLTDASGAVGNAFASGTAKLFLPVSGSPSTPVGGEVDGRIGVFPSGGGAPGVTTGGMAQFFVSLDISFSTPGPVRSGFIVLSRDLANNNGADGPDAETFNATLGSFDLSHILFGAGTAPPSPFTLGQDFLFHEDLMMRASANPAFGIFESAMPQLRFTFTLFEADGVTPVQVSLATPEPASWWFVGCGCFCLLAFGLRRRTLFPTP